MNQTLKTMLAAAALLGGFSVVGIGLVSLVHHSTEARIAQNQRQTLLDSLQVLIPAGTYNNDLLADTIDISDAGLGPKPVTVYRARKHTEPVGAVFAAIAPDGYGGDIHVLVAVKSDGSLAGVRVLAHKETPGLGDPIDEDKSKWIVSFTGRSLDNPSEKQWKVKRDGGFFDQFTGATITPRAVVKAVKNVLVYFKDNQKMVFSDLGQGRKNASQHN